ncbi:hypothetical protein, unlikely [Trypanosoma brucei gambiense DAL972]|uniref:Uncharacterized protein n=1 Tax=Trypanosoma brucei gambiense (strain MHOM/CI/86/DAL972) TaxID=679716 RepID=C9ZUA7_TRYB9|nr:hypothetical protein, unlikely [Trypanosoma brucei gambiense DAL972]CBH12994.1 hypothetical protein, unlikely [Trypanosoma brucei gambiense DAL972]|eukprot:XP_011775272.1 hypothetical protein, unlikely [Trypanosoma brucei gambiense DAL972]
MKQVTAISPHFSIGVLSRLLIFHLLTSILRCVRKPTQPKGSISVSFTMTVHPTTRRFSIPKSGRSPLLRSAYCVNSSPPQQIMCKTMPRKNQQRCSEVN